MESFPKAPQKSNNKPDIAAALMVISFLLVVITAAGLFFMDVESLELEESLGEDIELDVMSIIRTVQYLCGAVLLIIGVALLAGAYFAFKRMHRSFVLIACILGLISIGPFLLSSVLSAVALVLILVSKDEFHDPKGSDAHVPYESPPGMDCQDCGGHMTYSAEYGMWYCDKCRRYR